MRKDLIVFYSLILFTIVVIYAINIEFISFTFFCILGVFAFKSKRDYFWLAYALFAYDWVGSLFFLKFAPTVLIPGITFSFLEILSIVLFIKYYRFAFNKSFIFHKPIKLYLIYGVFLILLGMSLGMVRTDTSGGGLGSMIAIVRMILLVPLLYTVPKILSKKTDLFFFLNILFSFCFLNIFAQFYEIFNHQTLHLALGADYVGEEGYFTSNEIRPLYGTISSFFSIICGIYILTKKEKPFLTNYLVIILTINIISIFITATRGWIIAIVFFLLSQLVVLKIKTMTVVLILGLFFYSGYTLIPIFKKQVDFSYDRVMTIQSLAEGDLTMGGTNKRLTDRSEPVIKKFKEQPIIGWGFSGVGFQTFDPHVGNQSILMEGGIIAFIIIIYMQLYVLWQIYKRSKNNRDGRIILVFAVLSLYIVHSSSSMYYGYLINTHSYHWVKLFFISIFFGIIQSFLINAPTYEEKNSYKRTLKY